ncbi:MobC family plasmid mobilization relaxosome protein [Gordonia paraffinivorans]|uniref:MobC family plasmid mobilization relaxosome protein n=1 Tax=Gordonia paraffinivorans TaxID=175628 RepID=UPI001E351566|nr:MobC family plasmid mobilization relaxosome protein [Gordonia paraffinivorans]MCD2147397.1 MobC family plasmid mobilization relaxosome protein [Gordonia paraffinivorans]
MSRSEDSAGAFLRRRRRNHPGGRDDRIIIKVTATEKQDLLNRAEDAGFGSVQEFLMARAVNAEAGVGVNHVEKVAAWKEAMGIRNLLSGIAVNMNQIARHANTEREVPPDFEPAVAAVRRASDRVRDAFGEVFAVSFPASQHRSPTSYGERPSGPITSAEGEGWTV